MPNDQDQPPPPRGLFARGKKLWKAIISDAADQNLRLDGKELLWLEEGVSLLATAKAGGGWVVP